MIDHRPSSPYMDVDEHCVRSSPHSAGKGYECRTYAISLHCRVPLESALLSTNIAGQNWLIYLASKAIFRVAFASEAEPRRKIPKFEVAKKWYWDCFKFNIRPCRSTQDATLFWGPVGLYCGHVETKNGTLLRVLGGIELRLFHSVCSTRRPRKTIDGTVTA